MTSQESSTQALLPAPSLSQLCEPQVDYLKNFLDIYGQLSLSSKEELDRLLGFRMDYDPYQLYILYNHQNDPHLFLRICFLLIGNSLPAVQAWVAIPRLGFECTLDLHSNDIVDVSVSQRRDVYSIRMDVRLRAGMTLYPVPNWLLENPLPVPPLYETLYTDSADYIYQEDISSSTSGHVPDGHNLAHWDISTSPCNFGPQETQDPLNVTSRFALGGELKLLDEPTIPPARPVSGFSWLAADDATDSNNGIELELNNASTIVKERLSSTSQSFSNSLTSMDTKLINGSAPLTRTETLIMGELPPPPVQPTFRFMSEAKTISGAHNGTFTPAPARLNAVHHIISPWQSSPGMLESSTGKTSATDAHPGTDGLQRSDTVATIVDNPTVGGGAEAESSEEGAVRRLESLSFSAKSEEHSENPASDRQFYNDSSTPSGQEASATDMDVEQHPSRTGKSN